MTSTRTDMLTAQDWAIVREAHTLLDQNGGATMSFSGTPVPTTGFLVGGVVPEYVTRTPTWQSIADFVAGHLATFRLPGHYLGLWRDESTGLVHLDVTEHWSTLSNAIAIASYRDEIAVWNIGQAREVRL